MFSKVNLRDDRKAISVEIDGREVSCFEGDTVAAIVMLNGREPYRRSIMSGSARAPFCMMGICFECLIEIDGVPNQQGCLRNVVQGMVIKRQLGKMPASANGKSHA